MGPGSIFGVASCVTSSVHGAIGSQVEVTWTKRCEQKRFFRICEAVQTACCCDCNRAENESKPKNTVSEDYPTKLYQNTQTCARAHRQAHTSHISNPNTSTHRHKQTHTNSRTRHLHPTHYTHTHCPSKIYTCNPHTDTRTHAHAPPQTTLLSTSC